MINTNTLKLRVVLAAIAGIIFFIAPASVKADDCNGVSCRCADSRGCGSGPGGSPSNGLNSSDRWIFEGLFTGPTAEEAGRALNVRGVEAYKKNDFATAVKLFEKAIARGIGYDAIWTQNLANARAALKAQQDREAYDKSMEKYHLAALEQQKDALKLQREKLDQIKNSINNFAQTMTAALAVDGLDFDGYIPGNTPAPQPPSKPGPHTDTSVVDARVPHDGAHLTNQVPELKDSPAADRITKGFQAVVNGDWPAALAWWKDAANRDPGNATLKRSIELAAWMMIHGPAAKAALVSSRGIAAPSASVSDQSLAIQYLELLKQEHPNMATTVDGMIDVFKQRPTKDLKYGSNTAHRDQMLINDMKELRDNARDRGMNMLTVGDDKGADAEFALADWYSGGVPSDK